MHYSRAGLVALVFALIISFVSAAPVPVTGYRPSASSPRSNPSLNGQDYIQLDTPSISGISLSGRISTLPRATKPAPGVRYCLSSYLRVYTEQGLPFLYSSKFRLTWKMS